MSCSVKKQCGLTLIEMMIAIVLSAMLIFGVLQIFETNKRSFNLTKSYARVQEGGRIATELIAKDIRIADFWGCVRDLSTVTNHLNTGETDYTSNSLMDPTTGASLSGVESVAGSVTIGGIAVKPGSDTLTIRSSTALREARVVSPYTSATAIFINAGVGIDQGQMLLISDCNGGDLFANSSADTTTGEIGHEVSNNAGLFDNTTSALSHAYNSSSQILVPIAKRYFIGQPTAGVWSLYQGNNGVISELVRGVEDLQLMYGEDTNNDGSADVYRNATAVADMNNVISVRSTVTMAGDDGVETASLSRDYSVTANIRNRSL